MKTFRKTNLFNKRNLVNNSNRCERKIKRDILIAITALSMLFSSAVFAANTVIDVLVVYTKGTADAYGGDPTTRINQVFQVTNQIYKDSNLELELRVAKTLMVNYTDDNDAETALNAITFAQDPVFEGVAAAREQSKADMVILYRPFKSVQGSCGLAWIGGQGTNGDFSNPAIKNYMYSHIAINSCGDFVTAHELGHNMGLKHSRKQDGSGGTFPYALGYGVVNQFTTIMAYQSEFNVDYWTGKLYKFSSPDLTCKNVPCGVSRTDAANGADARYAISVTAPQIAKFYAAPATSSSSSSVSSLVSSKSSSSLSSSKTSSSIASSASSKTSSTSSKASSASSLSSSVSSKASSISSLASSASSKASSLASSVSSKASSSSEAAKSASSVASSKLSSSSSSAKPVVVSSSSKSSEIKSSDVKSSVKSSASSLSSTKSSASSLKSNVSSLSSTSSIKSSVSSAANSSKAAAANFARVVDVAQYGGADWANEVGREKALTIDQAKVIAAANPKITYFFITKGGQMSLGAKGVFRTGDVVFFSGKPWYGSAQGLADAYEKTP